MTILLFRYLCLAFLVLSLSNAFADDHLDGGSEAACDELEERVQQDSFSCGGRTFYCSDNSTWDPYSVDAADRRLCENLAALHCCNQNSFLQSVEDNCEWIRKGSFANFLGITLGDSFLISCNDARYLYGGSPLRVGHSNDSVDPIPPPIEHTAIGVAPRPATAQDCRGEYDAAVETCGWSHPNGIYAMPCARANEAQRDLLGGLVWSLVGALRENPDLVLRGVQVVSDALLTARQVDPACEGCLQGALQHWQSCLDNIASHHSLPPRPRPQRVYFFGDNGRYQRWSTHTDAPTARALPITDSWHNPHGIELPRSGGAPHARGGAIAHANQGIPAGPGPVPGTNGPVEFTSALDYGNGYLYFFSGNRYWRYNKAQDRFDADYPRAVDNHNWPGLPGAGFVPFDNAIYWGNHTAFFFKGSQYLRYDLSRNPPVVAAGYPKPIAGNWRGWPNGFWPVEASVDWGNGKVYFFKGTQYIRFDKNRDGVDAGYPLDTATNWSGLGDLGHIRAAVNYDANGSGF